MHRSLQAWLDACEAVDQAAIAEEEAEIKACWASLPTRLRQATAADIRVGAFIWYPQRRKDYSLKRLGKPCADWMVEARAWEYVMEVLRPSDPWKAYVSHNGSRLGLHGAYVEAGD